MDILSNIFSKVLYTSTISSFLIILVLLFKKIIKDKINPNFIYGLWVMVLINLLVPFDLNIGLDKFGFNKDNHNIQVENTESIQEGKTEDDLSSKTLYTTQDIQSYRKENPINQSNGWGKVIISIWLTGIVSMSLFFLFLRWNLYRRKTHFKLIKDEGVNRVFNNSKDKLNIKTDITLYTGSIDDSPYISGLFNPHIYISQNILDNLNNEQLHHVIMHELAHYKRLDLLANSLQMVILVIHWFNPLIWIFNNSIKEDRELACDNYVLGKLGDNLSYSYGMTVLTLAKFVNNSDFSEVLVSPFNKTKHNIKNRIIKISNYSQTSLIKKLILTFSIVTLSILMITNTKGKASNFISPTSISHRLLGNKILEIDTKSKIYSYLDEFIDIIDKDLASTDNSFNDLKFYRAVIENNEDEQLINLEYKKDNIITIFSMMQDDFLDPKKKNILLNNDNINILKQDLLNTMTDRLKHFNSDKLSDQGELYLNIKIHSLSDILSFELNSYESIPSYGNGLGMKKFINLDSSTGEMVTLENLISLDEANKFIHKEISKSPELYFDGQDGIDGFKSLDKNQGFYVKNEKVVVVFDKYDIAPGSTGFPEFIIDMDKLN